MPSLRRALSTPSVRASPYPVIPSSRSHRSHPHGHRRSSGSDVSDRKVLADIDWWRVADGQRERGEENDEDDEEERDVGEDSHLVSADSATVSDVLRVVIPDGRESAGVELERPSTPVNPPPLGGQIFGYSSQFQLGVFDAGPRTPTRRTASESSSVSSSVESTPEVLRTPIERLSFTGMGFADPGPEIPLFHRCLASSLTKHIISGNGDSNEREDDMLADFPICHDDLFA